LESFQLRKSLAQTRQELSTALYDYEGALRLLARVTKERDDARDALSKIDVGAGASRQSDAMEVDGAELPEDLAQAVDETQQKLSSTRRKRAVPKSWITAKELEEAEEEKVSWSNKVKGTCSTLADGTNSDEGLIVYGSETGSAVVYSASLDASAALELGSRITDAACWESKAFFSLASGAIAVTGLSGSVETLLVHAGAATGVSLHPSGAILGSVGADSSYVLYNLSSLKPVARVFADSRKSSCVAPPSSLTF
jgi:pre-mRNA-processing factor 19